MIPKFPITTTFDPAQSDYSKALWAIPAGKILMLLWRPSHLCGPDWFKEALPIAKRIERARPATADGLYACFKTSTIEDGDFCQADCREFSKDALDFFSGKRHAPYAGVISGTAAMIRE